jgi:hypothetical protein
MILRPFAFLVLATSAAAQSFLYSFSGTVTSLDRDYQGAAAAQGFKVGDPLSYTFYVDFGRPAELQAKNEPLQLLTHFPPPGELANFNSRLFYTEQVAGSSLQPVGGGLPADVYSITHRAYGDNFHGPGLHNGSLSWGDDNASVRIFTNDGPQTTDVETWQVGEVFNSAAIAGAPGGWSFLDGSVTLTSITAVPEPDPLALLVGGSAAFALCARKRRQRA